MLKSLRARILVSHLAIILLVFSLTFIVAFVPVRNAQTRVEIQHLEDIALPLASSSGLFLGRPNLSAFEPEILDAQAKQLNVRLVLLDGDGTVLHDTQPGAPLSARLKTRLHLAIGTLGQRVGQVGLPARLDVGDRSDYVGTIGGQRVVLTILTQVSDRYIAIVAPKSPPLLREFIIPLSLALAIGLLGALAVTVFLSQSIALPITRLTEAADAVAAGDLNRTVSGEGEDEVGRLVRSFNGMVTRLRVTYDSQRRLLANIAHELRTPLTSIQGYAQGLSDGVFTTDEQRSDALETIGEESERVNELLVQILELAKLESGQSGPHFRDVDIDEIVGRVLRRHRVEADNSGVLLSGPPPGARTIVADEALIDQAIDNLVRNAIRHTPEDGKVEVSVVQNSDGLRARPGIRIRVADTGGGIPAEALPHIFDRFYRATSDRPQDNGTNHGFGLGLAIVREIAAAHNGSVGVESELGLGTTFIIDLPGSIPAPQSSGGKARDREFDMPSDIDAASVRRPSASKNVP